MRKQLHDVGPLVNNTGKQSTLYLPSIRRYVEQLLSYPKDPYLLNIILSLVLPASDHQSQYRRLSLGSEHRLQVESR